VSQLRLVLLSLLSATFDLKEGEGCRATLRLQHALYQLTLALDTLAETGI